MNPLRLLMGQHDRVEGLLVDLQQASQAGEEARRKALVEFGRALRQHFELEERIFYGTVAERLILVKADHFLKEHARVLELLGELEASPPGPEFSARFGRLHDALVRHVSDEEIELFPEVKRRFDMDEMSALGERLERGFGPEMPAAEIAAAEEPAVVTEAEEPLEETEEEAEERTVSPNSH